jgi:hypothetical protein
MAFGAAALALAFAALWPPPAVSPGAWLALMLVLAYGAHSLLNIAYLAWGARLHGAGADRWREGMGLAGMLAASLVRPPSRRQRASTATPCRLQRRFRLLLLLAMLALLRRAPRRPCMATPPTGATPYAK